MKKYHYNSVYAGQAISFSEQHKVQFKKFKLEDTILKLLDDDEMFRMTTELDVKVHSINAFFTFFFVNDHSIDNIKKTGFSDILWYDIDARTLYAGCLTNEQRSFCGVQSKEFYPLCEFITHHDLWPDSIDIKINDRRKIKSRFKKTLIVLTRKVISKITRGKLFSTPYSELMARRKRGYATLIDELVKHDRQDLIDLCEKYDGKEMFPLVLRSVAECDPHRLMSMSADESIRYAMEKFYPNKYRRGLIEKFKTIYIPRTIEFALLMAALTRKNK